MLKVTCQLNDYSEPRQPEIKVHNHWGFSNLVELEVEGKRYCVSGRELKTAIDNAMNTAK